MKTDEPNNRNNTRDNIVSAGRRKSDLKFPGARRSGSLTIIKFAQRDSQGHCFWLALCDCQKHKPGSRLTPVRQDRFLRGRVTSCEGCRRRAQSQMARKQSGPPIEIPQPPASVEVSPSLETLTAEQLAELASKPEMSGRVWAEVQRRLKDDPRKANFLTFRWLMPADDADRADAFDGLMACCWNATEMRNRSGLFPRGYPETKQRDGYRRGGIAKETREAIKDILTDYLYAVEAFPPSQVLLKALNGGFHTDADVANALRRNVRKDSKYRFQYGNDKVSEDGEGDALTLFEVTKDDPESRTNAHNNLVEILFREKAQIVEELGEKGWTAWQEIVELVDSELVSKAETGDCQNEKDFARSLTRIFERVYGVKERMAFTHKSRLLALLKRILNAVQAYDWPRKSTPEELRAQSVFLPPVVPMQVIRQTRGAPVISRLLEFNVKTGEFEDDEWGGNRSSVGRYVPPDEWQEIKARLNREND